MSSETVMPSFSARRATSSRNTGSSRTDSTAFAVSSTVAVRDHTEDPFELPRLVAAVCLVSELLDHLVSDRVPTLGTPARLSSLASEELSFRDPPQWPGVDHLFPISGLQHDHFEEITRAVWSDEQVRGSDHPRARPDDRVRDRMLAVFIRPP